MADTKPETQGEIVTAQDQGTDVSAPAQAIPTEMNILQFAMSKGASIEELRALMDMEDRMKAQEAKKEFVAAMAKFKETPPLLYKDKTVGYSNKDGTTTGYSHISLAMVCSQIIPSLGKVGISHAWETVQEDGIITVICTLTHRDGHSENNSMSSAKDDSGKKNAIQQIASAVTYLQRYTFLAAVGMSASDQDDDGAGSDGDTDIISDEQFAELTAMIDEAGANAKQFCEHFKCDSVKHLPVSKFGEAQNLLRTKIKKNEKANKS